MTAITEQLTVTEPDYTAKSIPLGRIRADGGTQMRAALNEETVAEYAERFRETGGWWRDDSAKLVFPRVDLFYDGSDYWIGDGFHRIAAYRIWIAAIDGNQIDAAVPTLVHPGTRRDAILYAAGANSDHGLRRTTADKERAVDALLADDEWGKWSDREIARHCNVSHDYVGKRREKVTGRASSDGPQERVYVTKHGTQAVMNTTNIGSNPPRRDPEPRPARPLPEPTPARVVYDDQGNPRREPIYVQVWALEHLVQNWAAGKAISNDPHGLLALEQVKTLPATKWTTDLLAMIETKLSDPYRKGDLIQAINNVIEQRRQEERRAEAKREPPAEAPMDPTPPAAVPTVNEMIAATAAEYAAMVAVPQVAPPLGAEPSLTMPADLAAVGFRVETAQVPPGRGWVELHRHQTHFGRYPDLAAAVDMARHLLATTAPPTAAPLPVADAPMEPTPATLDDLPLVDSETFPGLSAKERLDRRQTYAWLRTVYREAKDSLEDYEDMTGDFASRGPLLRVLEPMIATLDRHLAVYEHKEEA